MAHIVMAMLILAVVGIGWLKRLAEVGPSGAVVLARFTTDAMTLDGTAVRSHWGSAVLLMRSWLAPIRTFAARLSHLAATDEIGDLLSR